MRKGKPSRPIAANMPKRTVRINMTDRDPDVRPWRELRLILGLHANEMGPRVGRSRQLWHFYEKTGEGSMHPRMDVLMLLAEYMDADLIIEFRPKAKLGGHDWGQNQG